MFLLQITVNLFLFFLSIVGIVFNRKNILTTLICIELMLLSTNLSFIIFSVYLDDIYGQLVSLFILAVAASESSIGLAVIILYFRVRGNISLDQKAVLQA